MTQSILANNNQIVVEKRAIAAFESKEVQQAIDRVIKHFRSDRNAAYKNQDDLLEQSAREHLFHGCMMACNETPRHPRFVWTLCHDRQWMDMDVPGSRFGQDNCDNVYRMAVIDKDLRYRIKGRFLEHPPVDFSICVHPQQVGENIFADTLGFIAISNIDVAADGSFEVLCDATPTGDRRNHLSIENGKIVNVRDTLGDWGQELPSILEIELLDEAPQDDCNPEKAKLRSAELGEAIATFFLEHLQHGYFESGPVNSMNPPWAAGSAGGLVTQASSLGHYGLEEDEAMVITADPMGASYVGMQITDIWMLSYEYRKRTSSLNHAQVQKSDDGMFRWVISANDLGVYNWLDSGGHLRGTILLRWHHIPGNIVPPPEKLHTQIVKSSELRDILPADTLWVDEMGRKEQRKERLSDYNNRVR